MSGRRGVWLGAAAFAVGLSLAGPQGVAAADTADSDAPAGGAHGSHSASSSPASARAGRRSGRSVSTPAPAASGKSSHGAPAASRQGSPARAVAAAGSVTAAGAGLSALSGGGGDGSPAAAPLSWTALAASRREIGGPARAAAPAMSVSTGKPPAAAKVAAGEQAVVRSISLPRAGTYGTDSTMRFVLHFSAPVEVTKPPLDAEDYVPVYLPVQLGFAMGEAQYIRGSGTRRLVFELTVPANNVGEVAIGRVSNRLLPEATAPVRIFDFNGKGHEVPPGEVAHPKIVTAGTTIAVSDTIPTVNTNRIGADARGPAVVSYGDNGTITTTSGPLGLVHRTVLTVNFDQPVRVQGAPTVPVNIGGTDEVLTYTGGARTGTLTFAKLSIGAAPGPASFRPEGQIIDLPAGADITDKLGNSVAVVLDDFGAEPGTLGPPLIENGNRLVVLGAHYQHLGTINAAQLNEILTTEAVGFYGEGGPGTQNPYVEDQNPASYWADYSIPEFVAATHDVELYRVAYNSTIPEQGNRPTLAYGLAAIPVGAPGDSLKLMSYQHGTLVGKGEVPSQSFDYMLHPTPPADVTNPDFLLYVLSYETRLNVAQFGGQGYAVIAADYFGVGNSLENDGYISKPSQQQACLDMYNASVKLLEAQGHPVSNLYLGGWSQGGLVTLDFLEKLESVGIPVTKAATASAPANVQLTSNAWYFNPRTPANSGGNTPDATWLNVVGELSNFSITGYAGYTASPLQMLGVNYEAARAMYMREYDALLFPWPYDGGTGISVLRKSYGLDPVLFPYSLQEVIAPEYSGVANEVAFSQTDYAQLLASSGAGQTYLKTPLGMYYGQQDEVIPLFAGTAVYNWQKDSFGKTNIWAPEVPSANHRATFLSAVRGELDWFNNPDPLAPPVVVP